MSESSEALNKAFAAYQQDPNDSKAFARLKAELLNLAKGAIYRVFRGHEEPHALAQDITSEILLAYPKYRGKNKATFSTWAYGIAKRKAIDELRLKTGGRRRGRTVELASKRAEHASPEELADLYACLNSADLTEKEVLFVRQIIGKDRASAKKRKRRAASPPLGLPHPLSVANRQRLSRLRKKVPLRDVTRLATNSKEAQKEEEDS